MVFDDENPQQRHLEQYPLPCEIDDSANTPVSRNRGSYQRPARPWMSVGPDPSGTFELAHAITILCPNHSDESHEKSTRRPQCALGHDGIMRCTGTSAEVGIR